jgi:glycosyltransferase involved in cell wall biosynthesis
MLACISKNDRAHLLFAELRKLDSNILDLGIVRASRFAKIRGALASRTLDRAQLRTDMDFSPVVANSMQQQTECRIAEHSAITHVLQWGAMYAPLQPSSRLPYSIITDGPFDPDDSAYPVEWTPKRWKAEYFARQREIYTGARFVFTLSHWARNRLLALHPVDPAKVVRIGWGPMFSGSGPNLEPVDQLYFVSIGNQWRRKGMDIVAEAGRLVHRRHPEVQTIIAGDPAGMRIPVMPGVKLIPRRQSQTEVAVLLRNARALVVASRFDASPHIVMEALQFGTPVIATNAFGIGENISASTLSPDGSPSSLAERMELLVSEPVKLHRVQAFAQYSSTGSWARSAQILFRSLQHE